MYFVDKDDNVIGLLKKKSVWYVIIRVIREQLRHALKKQLNVQKIQKNFHDRLTHTLKWLKFDNFDEWYVTGSTFFSWLEKQQSERGIDAILLSYRTDFPSLFREFKKET